MSAAHTAGPWEYDTGPSLSGRYHTVNDADGNMVCECYEGADDDNEANAHLIAAAPDMLATLEKYADQLCEGWCEQSPDCANFDDCGGCEARRIAWKASL